MKYLFFLLLIFYFYIERICIKNNKKKINIPKISVFLPIYNKEKYLKRSIKSIQKQTLHEIEIIPVNDGSTDKSLEILKELSKKDRRIIIINNDKNHGSLYSRAMGILKSKGEYLLCLDPDDEYQGPNNFKYLYNRAKSLNVDIITFFIWYIPDRFKSSHISSFNKIIKQPDLFESIFNNNNILSDCYITNKLIKKELFIKAYNLYTTYIYGHKWNYYEDNIWSILINKYAYSSIFINKKIYYYYKNKDSVMNNRGNILELKNIIYRNEMYKKIFNNINEEKYVIAGHIELLDILENNIEKVINNTKIKNMFINEIVEVKKHNYNLSREILNKTNYFITILSN